MEPENQAGATGTSDPKGDHPLRSEKTEEESPSNTLEVHTIDKVTDLVHTCLALEKEQSNDVSVDKKF